MRYLVLSFLMIGLTMSTRVFQDQQGRYDSCGSELDVSYRRGDTKIIYSKFSFARPDLITIL